jgi:hypothetical protein
VHGRVVSSDVVCMRTTSLDNSLELLARESLFIYDISRLRVKVGSRKSQQFFCILRFDYMFRPGYKEP